jgi:rhodanese-related sulfurtransferase
MGTNVVILDVRTPAEFAEGHLPGAVLIDFRAPDFVERVAKLDKSKQYLVHCAAGGRSARACAKLETLGFTNLVNLEGGLNAWKGAGKPVTK